MVTQKIVTRLSNDVLPPVRMVSGDVGREIQLEIYANDESLAPIDLETYSARITIIKPDKTFVIQDFDNDKVELPEQAGAVTGHGYYQIKIYTAGDHQIYTGQGPFIVDDDVLSDEMIESVAEVNGYEFPDDFLTDADLREYVTKYELEDALAGIIDDDTTDYNSTWSSAKISETLSSVTKTATGNQIEFTDGADAPLVKCVTQITGYQEGTGTPSPDNIRPIVAYTEGEIEVRGKNIWDEQWELGSLGTSGEPVSNSNSIRSKNYTPCQGNVDYYLNYSLPGDEIRICFYDKNKTFISRTGWLYKGSFQTPANARYMKLLTSTVYGSTYRNDIIIATGSQAVTYEPYTSTTHTTTYPSAIYRGSEDVVKGTVTAEWVVIASYAGETLPGEWISDRDEYAPGTTPTTGAQVAYELAAPTTSSVTPTNLPIKSLSGYNHIESSTGDMEVEYITQTYDAIMEATKLDNMKVYSTAEQVVGKWVDGSDVKEKTYIYTGTGPANPFTATIDMTGKSIIEVIPHYAKYTYGGGTVGYCAGSKLTESNSAVLKVEYDAATPPTVNVTSYLGSGTETYEIAFTIRYI